MAGKGNPIVYYKVTSDWLAASQTPRPEKRGSLLLVASIILSTPATGAEDVSSLSAVSMAFYLEQAGEIFIASPQTNTEIALQGGRGQLVSDIKPV